MQKRSIQGNTTDLKWEFNKWWSNDNYFYPIKKKVIIVLHSKQQMFHTFFLFFFLQTNAKKLTLLKIKLSSEWLM